MKSELTESQKFQDFETEKSSFVHRHFSNQNSYFGNEDTYLGQRWAITPDMVFISTTCVTQNITTLDNDYNSISIQVLDREIRKPPQCLQEFPNGTEVHLYSFDNTLVVLKCSLSSIGLDNYTVSIWNVKTLEFVMDIDFINEVKSSDSDNRDYLKSEISDVAIEENMIALHVYGSGLLGTMLPLQNVTLFFTLDTRIPLKENISFLLKVKEPITEEGFTDCGFIYMNKKIFTRLGESETDTVLQCFQMDSIKINHPAHFYKKLTNYEEDKLDVSIKLEPGNSYKVAMFYSSL